MTADKSQPAEHGFEKQPVKPGDKPPAGTPITKQADNVIQQRLKAREALQAFRPTRDPSNSFRIDMGDGSEVKDKRPINQVVISVAGLASMQPESGSSPPGKSETPKPDILAWLTSGNDKASSQLFDPQELGIHRDRATLIADNSKTAPADLVDKASDAHTQRGLGLDHPYRGSIGKKMSEIPEASWNSALKAFPQLEQLTKEDAIALMKALIRNELFHYDRNDFMQDQLAKIFGKIPDIPKHPGRKATLGFAQISPDGVDAMIREFPEHLKAFKGHEITALEDPKNAPLLVAAILAHAMAMYERHGVKPTIENLAYGFNPDVTGDKGKVLLPTEETLKHSSHVRNVMHELKIVTGKEKPTGSEC